MASFYRLDDNYALVRAEYKTFSIHFNTYRENIFFRQSWEKRLPIFGDDDHCYWITYQQKRIGGVCIEPNTMSALFLEPPFTNLHEVAGRLKKLLLNISDLNKPVRVYAVLPDQRDSMLRLGFLPSEARKIMIRPTERFESQEWDKSFDVIPPEPEHGAKLAELFYDAYSGSDSIGMPGEHNMRQVESDIQYYFQHNPFDIVKTASTVVFDRSTGRIAAACLVSLWEELPLIYDIAVSPAYREAGMAAKLLKIALSELYGHFDTLRLFVTVGNPAETLYYNLGFYSGLPQEDFYLPHRRI
ncbi:hypothetical protein A7K91_18750 [Paenibacillus oryzae]|uniref:N-acetyltransferase domain-containing protein n=1 Tax=Paenibacillus oryzae TaxID=1844972 RepID=A0A1A5YQX0_9BACL|nr:GNAT family N-acetyltransferase [Paenibacillus oryzae]OBR67973.1 hypothetical protein A7K91_18750 [Paenibacillus oryzae]